MVASEKVLSFYNPNVQYIRKFCLENGIEIMPLSFPQDKFVTAICPVGHENVFMIDGRFYFLSELIPDNESSEIVNLISRLEDCFEFFAKDFFLPSQLAEERYQESLDVRKKLYPFYSLNMGVAQTYFVENGGRIFYSWNNSFLGNLFATPVIYTRGRFSVAEAFNYEWRNRILDVLKMRRTFVS